MQIQVERQRKTKKWLVPCKADPSIPYEESVKMYNKHPEVFALWLTDKAKHVKSFAMYEEEYIKHMLAFLEKVQK